MHINRKKKLYIKKFVKKNKNGYNPGTQDIMTPNLCVKEKKINNVQAQQQQNQQDFANKNKQQNSKWYSNHVNALWLTR